MPQILMHTLVLDKCRVAQIKELNQLARLSGLTPAERELVAYWRAHGIPLNHASSFRYVCRKHLGGER